jgi:c-di-GMP-binding flagellar brake protein YcgR
MVGADESVRLRARVRESEGRNITLRCPECPFAIGSVLRLDAVVPGDARYAVEARLRSYRDRVLILDPTTPWVRVQRREYFRVRTGAVPVQIFRDLEHRTERDAKFKNNLYDMSGGGAQVETDLALEEDEQLMLRFQLPAVKLNHVLAQVEEEIEATVIDVEVRCRVIRVVKISAGRKRRVGVRFTGVSPTLRRQLMQWIYAVQSQRRAREVENLVET